MSLIDSPAPVAGASGSPPTARLRFTFDDLVKMRAAGVFEEGQHIELVGGEFVPMPSEGTFHMFAVRVLGDWLTRTLYADPSLDAQFCVYHHATLLFDKHHRREPDLMVAARVGPDEAMPPSKVQFIAECATTSAATDLNDKRLEYAAAGIPEYWVWETDRQRLTVFRRPQDGDYASKDTLAAGQSIAPLFAPAAAFEVALLLG